MCVLLCIRTFYGQDSQPIFKQISDAHSKIKFQNNIEETNQFNYYLFMHLYMGAGVATADFNNDGLPDIYFTSNRGENKLYLNKGDLQFEDITNNANVSGEGGFYTGVTTVDINNDGWLDIYVCRSGPENDRIQKNLLYINNQDLTFTESSMSYGLSEYKNHSIQSNFFDYDNDGDLDVYIVNTPVNFKLANEIIDTEKIYNDPTVKLYGGADKLYRNNGDLTFSDVSDEAGIKSDLFFGLTVSVSDFNNDGWKDIFVTNDFAGPDFLYMNNGDGTFTNKAKAFFQHTSNYSMGADIADVNNDGYQDIFALDMLPQDYKRSKVSMSMMPREVMYKMVKAGYHWQYMHNVMQINNGVFDNDKPHFRDLSYFAGIESTDWSWSCLLADFDLDGFNDIHVTNGILRDVTNMDARITEKNYVKSLKEKNETNVGDAELKKVRALYPSVKLKNYLFKNNGNLTFGNISSTENVGLSSFSNGSAYADFDNDGDLDLVCNNINDKAFLFENLSAKKGAHYLKVSFKGQPNNGFGYGTKVSIFKGNTLQTKELQVTRGYFSASEPVIHFGLGKSSVIDKLEVTWPDGNQQILYNIRGDKKLILNYKNAKLPVLKQVKIKPYFEKANDLLSDSYSHVDFSYDDFKDQLLLPHKLSSKGPCISVGDINNDGLDDFFIGGATLFSGAVYLQEESGRFVLTNQPDLDLDNKSEDTAALFFDANNDGYKDLYVVSGSYEKDENSEDLYDRLYVNNGKGVFKKADHSLPKIKNYGSCIVSLDFDKDGDLDVFVGGDVKKGKYPYPASSYLLENSNGQFKQISNDLHIKNLGVVTGVVSSDFDEDGDEDLLVVGEWMPITFLENNDGTFINKTNQFGFSNTSGWWNVIEKVDIDNDGDLDYIAGNLGLNYKFHASIEKPFHVYGSDFDKAGSVDIVLAKDINDVLFPIRGKMCSSEQMPFIKNKFPTFTSFAEANLIDIYGASSLEKALHLTAKEFRSSIIRNNGKGKFTIEPLPSEAQYSVVNGIAYDDFNGDGFIDIILAGNKYEAEVETSRADAGTGVLLIGNKQGKFKAVQSWESGFFVPGNVKTIKTIKTKQGDVVLVGENNAILKILSLK